MTRAKFKVNSKTELEGGAYRISLSAVFTGSEENKEFFRFTPSATCDLSLVESATADNFQVGAEYYVDFTKA